MWVFTHLVWLRDNNSDHHHPTYTQQNPVLGWLPEEKDPPPIFIVALSSGKGLVYCLRIVEEKEKVARRTRLLKGK